MEFPTRINNIPCICKVINYFRHVPLPYSSFEEEDVLEYEILDRKGYPAKWLEKYITPEVDEELIDQFLNHYAAQNYIPEQNPHDDFEYC